MRRAEERYAFGSIAVLAFACTAPALATVTCAVPDGAFDYNTEVTLSGHERVHVVIPVQKFTEIAATAIESGIDAHVELAGDDGGNVSQRADSPIRRWGPIHIIIKANNTSVALDIVGKEHSAAHGTVHLEAFDLSSLARGRGCIEAFRTLSMADAHYAKAEQIALGAKTTVSGVDAAQEYLAAAKDYQHAAKVLAPAGANPALAQANLAAAATLYQGVQNWSETQQAALAAQKAFSALNDEYGVERASAMRAAAEMEIALAGGNDDERERGDRIRSLLAPAQQTFTEVARVHHLRHEPFDEALALNNVGLAKYYQGDFEGAISVYRQVVPIYERLAEAPREAQVLQNIALVEHELGRLSDAKHLFAQALRLIDESDNPRFYAEIVNNRALAEYESRDLDAALQDYGRALNVLTSTQSSREQARSLQGIGAVYHAVGDRDRALEYFQRALALRSVESDPRGRAASLRSLANVLTDLKRPAEALQLRQQSLALQVAPSQRARTETNMAIDLASLGQAAEARVLVEQALSEVRVDRSTRAFALVERATLQYDQQVYREARRSVEGALSILRRTEVQSEEFAAWLLEAKIDQALHDRPAALEHINRALAIAEAIRTETANLELRAGLWQPIRPAFDVKIGLLAQGQDSSPVQETYASRHSAMETLMLAERSRARSLADYRRIRAARTPSGGSGNAKIAALYRELAERRLLLEARLGRTTEEDPQIRGLRTDIAALRREIDSLNKSASAVRSPSANIAPQIASDIRKVLEMIPPHTAVIEYWLGEKTTWAWIVKEGNVRMIRLGPSGDVENAARKFQRGFSAISAVQPEERERLANTLYELIVGPLPADVLADQNLLFVPDGALHYVSFAALAHPFNGRLGYLITDHAVATAPSLSSLANDQKQAMDSDQGRLLMVSDPVYLMADDRANDSENQAKRAVAMASADERPRFRSPSSDLHFARLPGTAREAQSIAGLFAPAKVDSISGFDASREEFLRLDLSRYRIIHVAAHAISDAEAPQLSALVLSQIDRGHSVVPSEVFAGELSLKQINADLVVLSGCETAVGREMGGEGLLGIRYAVLAAGARSVVASLWEVPDRPAADLMTMFYTHVIRQHESPTAALAEAMREGLKTYRDPALWAPFEISITGRASLMDIGP